MTVFQKRLIEQRKLNGLTQCDIAKSLNIAQPSYIRYENGTAEPSIATLIALADIFEISIDYLVGRTDL